MKFRNPFKRKQIKRKQTLFIRCEKCGNELCASNSFVSDSYDKNGDNHVIYCCSNCGHKKDYNFDIAPIPIKWSELRKIQNK